MKGWVEIHEKGTCVVAFQLLLCSRWQNAGVVARRWVIRLLTLFVGLCVVVEGKLDGYRAQAHLVCLGALQLDKVFKYICCENIVF